MPVLFMQNFKNLVMYQKAFELSKEIYKQIGSSQQYKMRDQIIGSTTAICANLAEMASFDNKNQMKQKIKTCIGEANETEFWINFLEETHIISKEKTVLFLEKIKMIRIMLCKYLQIL